MSELKTYVATSIVNAAPLTRLQYNEFRGWDLPADENGDDLGYLVENLLMPANHDDFKGHISWLPAEAFEKVFTEVPNVEGLEPHQIRACAELSDLTTKVDKLEAFVETDVFNNLPPLERTHLTYQLRYMTAYKGTLNERVTAMVSGLEAERVESESE